MVAIRQFWTVSSAGPCEMTTFTCLATDVKQAGYLYLYLYLYPFNSKDKEVLALLKTIDHRVGPFGASLEDAWKKKEASIKLIFLFETMFVHNKFYVKVLSTNEEELFLLTKAVNTQVFNSDKVSRKKRTHPLQVVSFEDANVQTKDTQIFSWSVAPVKKLPKTKRLHDQAV